MAMKHTSLAFTFIFLMIVIRKVFAGYGLNLYYTDKTSSWSYDCLYTGIIDPILTEDQDYVRANQIMQFCLRPENRTESIISDNYESKRTDHEVFTFAELKKMGISSGDLFDWSAPITLAENYQIYLDAVEKGNSSEFSLLLVKEYTFYNCTLPWFGSRCEYYLSTTPITLDMYVYEFFTTAQVFYPASPTCFVNLNCDRTTPHWCLDWREICDGYRDCPNGEDEKHCWRLEANLCNDDEYRCHIGQCIPLDFYHDDKLNPDCLDRSDEPADHINMKKCVEDLTFRCEDASCYPQLYSHHQFSCGNGECIVFMGECYNNRHTYMELSPPDFPWIGMSPECFQVMRCLTDPSISHSSCGCGKGYAQLCVTLMQSDCRSRLFLFPTQPVLLGHVYFIYDRSKFDRDNDFITPRYVCFNASYCKMNNKTLYTILNRTCIDYDNEFGKIIQIYSDWDQFLSLLRELLWIECSSTKYNCSHSQMYNCDHSSECISTARIRDGVEDCPLGDDEWVHLTCSPNETNVDRFMCLDENLCLSPLVLNNGAPDCKDGSDEWTPNERLTKKNVLFKFVCDGVEELLPININGKNMTDETECDPWLCNVTWNRCNSFWDCPRGEDETGCKETPILCPYNHHTCISPKTRKFICLPIDNVNNNIVDCLGGFDERRLCRDRFDDERYLCSDGKRCAPLNDIKGCQTNPDSALANMIQAMPNCGSKNSSVIEKHLCSLYIEKDYDYLEISLTDSKSNNLMKYKENDNFVQQQLQYSKTIHSHKNLPSDSCYRGISVAMRVKDQYLLKCMCPPSYYGNQCGYQSERVSLTAQVKSATDWRSMFVLVFMLITEENEIESYEHRYYYPSIDCTVKWNLYLLYRSHPKNMSRNYSVRIDAFNRRKTTLEYRTSWLHPIDFLFLPVNRLAVKIIIPPIRIVMNESGCDLNCHEHGTCVVANINTKKRTIFCRCHPGWYGKYCEKTQIPSISCSCALESVCISSYPTSICVCPLGRGGPRCHIRLSTCDKFNPCLNGGQCVYDDERRNPSQITKCICPDDFWGEYCEKPINRLIVSFDRMQQIPPLIYIHIIQDRGLAFHVRITTFKKIFPYETMTVFRSMTQQYDRVYIEFDSKYYLVDVRKNNQNEYKIAVMPENKCFSVDDLFESSWIHRHFLERIKYYHVLCHQHSNTSCFYDEVHLCRCDAMRNAECLLFEHNKTYICQGDSGNCEHEGQCFQDDPHCPKTSVCLCSDCYYGSKCQFSTRGFSLSLNHILGYQIRPNTILSKQMFVVKFSFVFVLSLFIFGLVNGSLSVLVFSSDETRKIGCGYYLLAASLLSIFIVTILLFKFMIFISAQMNYITGTIFLRIQCASIDFILQVSLNTLDWLSASVNIERVLTIIQGVHFDQPKSKQMAKRIIAFSVMIITLSNCHDPIYRRLVRDEEEQQIWCIVNYHSSVYKYNSIVQSFHLLGPFISNMISAILIIYFLARRRFNLQRKMSFTNHLYQQLKSNKHLIISPIILVVLASPRLVISLSLDCIKANRNPWLLLIGYFTSFIPAALIFFVFVLPSDTYKSELKKCFILRRRR